MPPKKASQPSKKTQEKKKEKIIEDKTFGLKNKKGKKQQTFIKQVTQQVKYANQSMQKVASMEAQAKKDKEFKKKEKDDLDTLFKPIAAAQKISKGADPKSVLCEFFKQGLCTKGDKCKFSHDLNLERKSEKRSMYVDMRDGAEDTGETMENWDEEQLRSVVDKKHGQEGKTKPKTDKVCKHFIHAIEKGIYGWFWECPNGGDACMYRHALPPGFILKKNDSASIVEKVVESLEELVERERGELISSGKTLTPVTLESFLQWKQKKLKAKKDEAEATKKKKRDAYKQGKMLGISGREMFEFNPEAVVADDDEMSEDVLFFKDKDNDEDEGQACNISDETFLLQDKDAHIAIDEDLFLMEAKDPLNEPILAKLLQGDMMLENIENDVEDSD